MRKLLAFEFTSDTASFKLFDNERVALNQVTSMNIQDEVTSGVATLHMQDTMLRHHLIMHASKLDTFGNAIHRQIQRVVQDIARASTTASGVAPMQIGTMQSKIRLSETSRTIVRNVKDKNEDELMHAEKSKDNQC